MRSPDPLEASPAFCPICAKALNAPAVCRAHLTARSPRLFLREWINRPGRVGAVWPSSKRLAQCMAAQTPMSGTGLVIELGGGTGVITQALLAQGLSRERLRVVERSPAFARHLRQRFPSVQVIQGDAARLAVLLPEHAAIDAVVSSLPLRSLPRAEALAIVEQWRCVLPAGGALLQFSYALQASADWLGAGFALRDSQLIWRNLPPARVMRFERLDTPGH